MSLVFQKMIIKELSQIENINDSNYAFNDRNENFISQFKVIGYPDDEERQELKAIDYWNK